MKATRRLAALAAAATMTACMAIPMVAMNVSAEGTTGTITINETAGVTSTLKAFQIFAAEMEGTGEEAIFVVKGWGEGIDVAKLKAALGALNDTDALKVAFGGNDGIDAITADATGAQKVADVLTNFTDGSDEAKAFAKIAAKCTTDSASATVTKEADTTAVNFVVEQGYYIVVDSTAASNGSYTAYTLGILKVLGGETASANIKREFPQFDKQIGDINDTTNTAGTYTFNEAADHDIGDAVPFKLIATMPSNIDQYTAYTLKFYDDLQADVFELDPDSFKITYSDSNDENVNVIGAFTKSIDSAENDLGTDDKFPAGSHTDSNVDFTLTCNNIKTISNITLEAGGQFTVEYTAKLTENAKLGATGNWNGAYLEYSNNPNWDGTGTSDTGTSPVDYVVAFTYQAIVNKVDGVTNKPLEGAEFTLYKYVGGTDESNLVKIGTADGWNGAKTTFEFKGLDDGKYVLKETTVPDGYNGAADIEFIITAAEVQTDGGEALGSFTSDNPTVVPAGNVFTLNTESDTYEAGDVKGAVSATVENKKGSTLPSTGGIGTTIFYVVGGLMVGVAGVYLIAKKRMNNNEQ